ncbi:MAG: transposase [Pseudomonadota bacterium]
MHRRTYHACTAEKALRKSGCWFLFLPPYRPDLNPIEQAFSKLKAHLRKIGDSTFDQLIMALGHICHLFSPDQCRNFSQYAGYAST